MENGKRLDFAAVEAALYQMLPMFQRQGAAAYKKDLTNIRLLCAALGAPETRFRTLHVAGTNGKGSTSSMLAALLQNAGYARVGLFTSPHLKSFTERIRINGVPISEEYVVTFYQKYAYLIKEIKPSFFEFTTALAFLYFAENEADMAVIETGLGGRLDSTNIITPFLSVITNIDFDHTDMLGETLEKIAFEKAGIIKPGVPVVVGASRGETSPVFEAVAKENNAPLYYASQNVEINVLSEGDPRRPLVLNAHVRRPLFTENTEEKSIYSEYTNLSCDLAGDYQPQNIATVLQSVELLRLAGVLPKEDNFVYRGLVSVKATTGLQGRMEVLSETPLTVADVAHNFAGLTATFSQISKLFFATLRVVFGASKEKDLAAALSVLPKDAVYYFCQADVPRALDKTILTAQATNAGLKGSEYNSVTTALRAAQNDANENDLILITGSIFVVAEII